MGTVTICNVCHQHFDEHVECDCARISAILQGHENGFPPYSASSNPQLVWGAVEMGG